MDSELRADRCETCRFWERWEDIFGPEGDEETRGQCRRYPPTFACDTDDFDTTDEDGDWTGRVVHSSTWWCFPIVVDDDWCGEWQPKSTPPNPVLARPIARVEDVLAAITPPPST